MLSTVELTQPSEAEFKTSTEELASTESESTFQSVLGEIPVACRISDSDKHEANELELSSFRLETVITGVSRVASEMTEDVDATSGPATRPTALTVATALIGGLTQRTSCWARGVWARASRGVRCR